MIFPIINDTGRKTVYCGPTAICLLTGTPASRVEQMLRRYRNEWCREHYGHDYYKRGARKRGWYSTFTSEVTTILERLGCKLERVKVKPEWSTIAALAYDLEHVKDVAFLVHTKKHFSVVSEGCIHDTGAIKSGRNKVKGVWQVKAPAKPRQPTGVVKRMRVAQPKADKPTAQQKRAQRVQAQVIGWEARLKRAQTALKKLRPKLRRYEKLGVLE